jgi:protein transport protein SEC31
LYDDLNNDTIAPDTVAQLSNIVRAIQSRDANNALAMHVDMITQASGDWTHWAVSRLKKSVKRRTITDGFQPGVKQLIRLGL